MSSTMTMRIGTTNPFAGLEEIVTENVPLAPKTWYRIGGPARWFVQPRSVEELQEAAQRCAENEIPIYVLGLGANLLVTDEGVSGAVFKLDQEHWRRVKFESNIVEVGSGVDIQKLILRTVRQGLAGIESLAGIPGTIGGGIRMNCGGKFGDIGSRVTRVQVMDSTGTLFERTKDDLVFEYRTTNISAPFILGATLELEEDDPERIMKRTKEIWMFKRNSQPLNTKNAGCIFKNPRGLSAGALIDQAGLKGMRVGGAEVSAKHANFIIAHSGCRADDVLKLVKIIREKVYEKNEIHLESEVKIWP
ncbi:MAG TPA: UDP-N-acetylmuramate dehydrogenase [Tepidisphaeraceae bacterium]|jgi:UDP-N-acetylmuramate dehydrogenase|nr:UDP-N-acetylmuramate dehydrogenase [Tepidisphaeraceae bacterium]